MAKYRVGVLVSGIIYDEFDCYWDDLDSASAALFDEKMIGKPTEIRIE